MDNSIEKTTTGDSVATGAPLSLGLSQRGVKTGRDFAGLMSALMSDLIEGRISPGVANAVCNAGGKMLKVVEMQMKYGHTGATGSEKVLQLTEGN